MKCVTYIAIVTLLLVSILILNAAARETITYAATPSNKLYGALASNNAISDNTEGISSYTVYDISVYRLVLDNLTIAFQHPGEITVYTRIQYALKRVTDERDKHGNSTNEKLRDAEYYLHGLYASTAKDIEHAGFTLGAPVYDAVKFAAIELKDRGYPWIEKFLRTNNKDNPLSPPGGWTWAYKGLLDGTEIDGFRYTKGMIDDRGYKIIDGFPKFNWIGIVLPKPSPPLLNLADSDDERLNILLLEEY